MENKGVAVDFKGKYVILDGDKYIRCPYDSSHIVSVSKEIRHLFKCRNNYVKAYQRLGLPATKIMCKNSCGFELYPPELAYHEEDCFRIVVFGEINTNNLALDEEELNFCKEALESVSPLPQNPPAPLDPRLEVSEEEDWGNAPKHPTFSNFKSKNLPDCEDN